MAENHFLSLPDQSVFDEEPAALPVEQSQSLPQRPVEDEVLVFQSEFAAGQETTTAAKRKKRKRVLLQTEEEANLLDDYYTEIVKKKNLPRVVAASTATEWLSETQAAPAAGSQKLAWLETLQSEAQQELPMQPEAMETQTDVVERAGTGRVLEEPTLDETATSFIELLRRRGLLRKNDEDEQTVYRDKRGKEIKGSEMFKEISRRFRPATTGPKKRI